MQLLCCLAMAQQTKRANILEVAFASTFSNGQNVVGIPQALARAAAKSPVLQQQLPSRTAGAPKFSRRSDGVHST